MAKTFGHTRLPFVPKGIPTKISLLIMVSIFCKKDPCNCKVQHLTYQSCTASLIAGFAGQGMPPLVAGRSYLSTPCKAMAAQGRLRQASLQWQRWVLGEMRPR